MRLLTLTFVCFVIAIQRDYWQSSKLFSKLAFEDFLCLYFRVKRRFMLRMQRELNRGKLNHGSTCTTWMVQLNPMENFNLEVILYQNLNVKLYQQKVMNSDGSTLWKNNGIKQKYLCHYELWNSKIHFQFFTLSSQKHFQTGSFLHQIILDLSHKPKCIPNRFQTTGVAHQSLDCFI